MPHSPFGTNWYVARRRRRAGRGGAAFHLATCLFNLFLFALLRGTSAAGSASHMMPHIAPQCALSTVRRTRTLVRLTWSKWPTIRWTI